MFDLGKNTADVMLDFRIQLVEQTRRQWRYAVPLNWSIRCMVNPRAALPWYGIRVEKCEFITHSCAWPDGLVSKAKGPNCSWPELPFRSFVICGPRIYTWD